MASKALIDLVTWHGPQVLDQAICTKPDANYEKTQFALVDISDLNDDDLNVGVLSILFYGFHHKDDWEFSLEGDNRDNVSTILGEGFAKVLLSENCTSISSDLLPVILAQLVRLYFLEETKEL
jgi:condensin complex subunit 3